MKITGPIPDNILRLMPASERRKMGKAGLTFQEAAQKREAVLEREIHHEIENYLRLRSITYRHDRMDRRTTGTVGWPDFTFAVRGVPCGIEVKRPGNEPDPDQLRCHAGLLRDGWRVMVVYSVADVVRLVHELEGRNAND